MSPLSLGAELRVCEQLGFGLGLDANGSFPEAKAQEGLTLSSLCDAEMSHLHQISSGRSGFRFRVRRKVLVVLTPLRPFLLPENRNPTSAKTET